MSKNRVTTPSLLPPNASVLEHNLGKLTERLNQIQDTEIDPIKQLSRMWVPIVAESKEDNIACHKDLLPWLAWALSVDSWDHGWKESVQRRVIKESVKVHQHKGTLGSLKRALAALGIRIEVTEWWQVDPPGDPYTFSIKIFVNDNLFADKPVLIDQELYDKLKQLIDEVKPVRSQIRSFDTGTNGFEVFANFSNKITVTGVAQAVTLVRYKAEGVAPS